MINLKPNNNNHKYYENNENNSKDFHSLHSFT